MVVGRWLLVVGFWSLGFGQLTQPTMNRLMQLIHPD